MLEVEPAVPAASEFAPAPAPAPMSAPLPSATATTLLTAVAAAAALSACGGASDATDAPQRLAGPVEATNANLLGADRRKTRAAADAALPSVDELLDWAERHYPQFFPTRESNRLYQDIVYRHYPGTGNYVGVRGTEILILGPISGGQLTRVGSLADYAGLVAQDNARDPRTDAEAARFLLHAQFSATPAEIADVRRQGYVAWLDAQLALPPGQTAWDWLVSRGYSAVDTNEFFFANGVYHHAVWNQLITAPDAVRKRWALALSEIFVVSWRGIKDVMNWDSFAMAAYWDLLNEHAFGSYRALLEALTLNPAMGAFLSTRGNEKENPATGRLPDENYAREVMQLMSIGLHELNMDGSVRRDAQGRPVETYDADDVSQLARVFTGWDQDKSGPKSTNPNPPHQRIDHVESTRGRMVLRPERHSPLEKRFLGVTIPAGTPAPQSLGIALDALAQHPNVPPFLARQFIQRLVTSNPSPGYVRRVAQVFADNGAGVRGDLKAVLRAVLLDDEALSAASLASPSFGKLREPMVRIAQWGRTFAARSVQGTWKMRVSDWEPATSIGQAPLDPPSVFSFFRPGYVPPGTAMARDGATAPEFQIVNESSVATWANFMESFTYRGFWVRAPEQIGNPKDPTATDGPDIVPDYAVEKALVTDTRALVARLNLLLCANQLSDASVETIVRGLQADRIRADSSDDFKQIHVARALIFVMCSPEYLAQR